MSERRSCPTCGEHHPECDENLLDTLSYMASLEVNRRLSARGRETLKIVMDATEIVGFVEAWDAAEGLEDLPEEETRAIEAYFARVTLIAALRSELYGEVR